MTYSVDHSSLGEGQEHYDHFCDKSPQRPWQSSLVDLPGRNDLRREKLGVDIYLDIGSVNLPFDKEKGAI